MSDATAGSGNIERRDIVSVNGRQDIVNIDLRPEHKHEVTQRLNNGCTPCTPLHASADAADSPASINAKLLCASGGAVQQLIN